MPWGSVPGLTRFTIKSDAPGAYLIGSIMFNYGILPERVCVVKSTAIGLFNSGGCRRGRAAFPALDQAGFWSESK